MTNRHGFNIDGYSKYNSENIVAHFKMVNGTNVVIYKYDTDVAEEQFEVWQTDDINNECSGYSNMTDFDGVMDTVNELICMGLSPIR